MRTIIKSRRGMLMATAASSMVLGLAAAGAATAQDEGEDDAEVITVTGFRSAIESAIDTKRESTSIVEAISAEDIGKLPDNSIAESLARLPGLAAQRLRGRAQVISVRGLGPDFTTALLNGREQVTAGDNRGVEFDQYPSELLSSVLVYKTPEASLTSAGLAGTADLRTIRPLDQDERTISLSARYEWNEYGALNAGSAENGHRLTGFYVDQFADDTVGLALGVAIQSSPTQAERWNAWGYPSTGGGELVIGGAKPYVSSNELERTGVVGTLEFRPNDRHHTTIDAFYSHFEDNGILRGIELPLAWSAASLQPGYTITDGLVTQGVFDGVIGVMRNDIRTREADVYSFGINHEFFLNDQWGLEFDLSYSAVDRLDTDLESYAGVANTQGYGTPDTLGFMYEDQGFVFSPSVDYADPSIVRLTSPQGWGSDPTGVHTGGQVGFRKLPQTEDELMAFRFSAERDFQDSWISSVEFGISYSDREKNKDSVEHFLFLSDPAATELEIPSNLLLAPTALDFLGIPGMVSYDPNALIAAGLYDLVELRVGDVTAKAWSVNEAVTTAYVQANVDTEMHGVPVRGNFGIQVVSTDQSSSGAVSIGDVELGAYSGGDEYTEVLPSANFSFEVADNTFIRLGAARTLMRARMDQMRASQQGGVNTTVCAAGGTVGYDLETGRVCLATGGGNPSLRPYMANSFDISFERYFADGAGYVALAAFHKDIDQWVDGSTTFAVDWGAAGVTALDNVYGAGYAAANPEAVTGTASGPTNSDGGWLQGIEFSTHIPGDVLAPALEGFGVLASFSYTDSEIEPQPGNIQPIAGLSERVGNITVYYENGGFEARVSNRWRSDFLGEVTGFGAGREFRDVFGESVVDAQIGYEFGPGRLDGVRVYLQGNNLTDEAFVTGNSDDERLVQDHQRYGASYLAGVSWRY
jgi:iron complex outermembrane receptor protein